MLLPTLGLPRRYIIRVSLLSAEGLKSVCTVSYTHLEVYKRQELGAKTAEAAEIATASVDGDVQLTDGEYIVTVQPVSYTHLDVYKRQEKGLTFKTETD